MYFTIWHYLVVIVALALFGAGIYMSFKQTNKKIVKPMILSVTLISIFLMVVSIIVLEKYTKSVEVYKLKNKRILSIEKIIYTGIVKNTGNYKVAEVTVDIKLVSKGVSELKGDDFYSPSGFFKFFFDDKPKKEVFKSNVLNKSFVVAKDLEPGQAKSFRVYFDYPPHFRNVSQYVDVYGH